MAGAAIDRALDCEFAGESPERWLAAKLSAYDPCGSFQAVHVVELIRRAALHEDASAEAIGSSSDPSAIEASAGEGQPLFANSFQITDLFAFDDAALRELLAAGTHGLTLDRLAIALRGAPEALTHRVSAALPSRHRDDFATRLAQPAMPSQTDEARRELLDTLFWELTYWVTPDLYEALTEGEQIHTGIFRCLTPALSDKDVLDAGAGSGRATFASLHAGARRIFAVEPSPGLLRILDHKRSTSLGRQRIVPMRGRFDSLPLEDNSVDLTLSCSAFTADPQQGGDCGLAELRRVTRPGGQIAVIWPRPEDYGWLAARGFHYVALPTTAAMSVSFRSQEAALSVAQHFYARNSAVFHHLLHHNQSAIPYAVIGVNPPHDYCWLQVEK